MKLNFSKVFLVLWTASATLALEGDVAGSKRVLFLGNSVWDYRGGVHQPFLGFCNAAGLNYHAVSQMRERENSHGIEFLGHGRIPLSLPEVAADREILSLIESGDYDYVVLEGRRSGYLLPEWVGLPEDRGTSLPYEENLAALSTLHQAIVKSGAQTVLYMHPGLHTHDWIKLPLAQIYLRLHADLENFEVGGAKHEVILVPASLLWRDAIKRYGIAGWYSDPGHGNALARYASGCLLYTYLTGLDPRQNDFRELPRSWDQGPGSPMVNASNEDADWVKTQVWLYYSTRLP